MSEPRIEATARLLVRYCLDVKRGTTIGIECRTVAEPLAQALCEEVLRAGAFPAPRLTPDGFAEAFLTLGRPHHFTTLPPFERAYAGAVDATISIQSETNTRALSAVPPRRQAMLSRTMKPVMTVLRRKRWVITLFPTAAYAQDAEMSLRDYEDFVYGAMFADTRDPAAEWRRIRQRQAGLIARLKGAREVRIVGPETDLRLAVAGRTFRNSDGRSNMPSGEIFTSPVETSAEGHILYDFPVCRGGREVDGIRLVFRKGAVVEASARKGEAYLKEVLQTDPGARRLGELGIGTNTRIQRFTRNILFDEKIGGTVHLAIGRGFTETGGKNHSAVHWDMIKDLRRGGAIYVDGKLFQKDGRFTG
jgi:aminopeptidase